MTSHDLNQLTTRADLENLRRELLDAIGRIAAASPPSPVCGSKEAAKLLGVCTKTLYGMVERKEIRAARLGTGWRFRRSDLLAYIDAKLDEAG